MPPKLTPEFVESAVNQKGWILLSEYTKANSNLDFQCDKGHKHKISYHSLKIGRGCGKCANNIKYTQEFIATEFNKKGWTLLSEYKNTESSLNFECDKGHIHKISYSSFQQGKGCAYCAGNIKYTQEFIQNEFTKRNYKLLSQYKSNTSLLNFVCDKGHNHKISYANLKKVTVVLIVLEMLNMIKNL